MIDPKELRLGNYLIINGKIGRAISITENSIQIGINPSDDICIAVMNNNDCPTKKREDPTYISNTVSISSCQYIEPIPLTEEILFKCGAVREEGGSEIYFCFNESFELHRFNENGGFAYKCGRNIIGNYIYTRVYYLHHLQNLYFIATGTELNIYDI